MPSSSNTGWNRPDASIRASAAVNPSGATARSRWLGRVRSTTIHSASRRTGKLKIRRRAERCAPSVFVALTMGLSRFSAWFDRTIVDGIVNLAGWAVRRSAVLVGLHDKYVIDGAVNGAGPALPSRQAFFVFACFATT